MCTEVDSGERMARRVDPPFVEVIIDGVADQKVGLAIGGELAGPDEADVGPGGAEVDSLQLEVGIDPPVVQVMVPGVGDEKIGNCSTAEIRKVAVRDIVDAVPMLTD